VRLSQFIALADSDRDALLFDLKAKATVSGNRQLVERLTALNGKGDTSELLGELQRIGALPDLEPDEDQPEAQSGGLVFPVEVLPEWHRTTVEQTAACVQVTVSHAAQDARLALNALVGPSLRYVVNDDWSRHCGLYLCIVAESGTGKTRTSGQLMKPVYDLQDEVVKESEPGRIAAAVDRIVLEAERDELNTQIKNSFKSGKKKPGSAPPVNVTDAKTRILEIEKELRATEIDAIAPTLWETDVTVEYLLRVIIENGGQISIVGAETPLFGVLVGRYTQGVIESVEVFNDAYDGAPVSAGRMKNKKAICKEPRLAVSVGTQPTVLFKTSNSSTLLERGTLARFSFYEPPNILGDRDMKLKRVDPAVKATYMRNMGEIARAYRATPPPNGELFERKEPTTFTFSKNAVERFEKWRQLREAERQQGGRLRRLTGFQARIDDMLPRTAAQLHVLWHGANAPPFIPEETVERAILVTEFDIQSTDRVFAKMGLDTITRIAEAIEDWAQAEKVTDTTIQKIARASLGMEKTTDQVRAACFILQRERALTMHKVTTKRGGRPSEKVTFNKPF